jgi:NAD(P)-dependent dehydrogenase (short-subunit alcohol dehydrogenase family)
MKYVFFTGATGGLGEACVEALSRTGRWTIFAAGTNEVALDRLGELPNVIPVRVDVTKQASVEAALAAVKARTETLDAVVNFAGLASFTSLVEGDSLGAIERLLAVNLVGTARVNRTFFEMIHKGHGRIVNCSSESGWLTPTPFAGPYVLSKYAVEAYSDSLRRELMFLGIPVIKIQPGSFETPVRQKMNDLFQKSLAETQYYRKLLLRLKPLMVMELGQRNDVRRLADALLKALESNRPRLQYRVGTGRLLALLELFPERWVDKIYMLVGGGLQES